jgi:hypothetical protein
MPQPNWLGRNWKWVVPVGCLLPVLLVGGCALMVFFFAAGVMKQSDAYKIALAPCASELGCDRSDRLSDFANRNHLWQQQGKWTDGRSEFIHSVERTERESYPLCRSEEIGRPLDVSNDGREN